MISALSAHKEIITANAGQKRSVQQPTQPPQAPQNASTDDPNALPAVPDGSSNNQQTPQQQQIIVIKEPESWWKKALPWAVAGLVALGGGILGSHHLGKGFLKENVSEYANELIKPESKYKQEYLDPLFSIAKALDEHLAKNPDDKETVKTLRDKLRIGTDKNGNPLIGIVHGIHFNKEEAKTQLLSAEPEFTFDSKTQELVAKLPNEVQNSIEKLKTDLDAMFPDKTPSNMPHVKVDLVFSRNEKGEIQFAPFDNGLRPTISTGWQVATATAKDWANQLINRGEKEVNKNNKPTTEYTGEPRNIEIT